MQRKRLIGTLLVENGIVVQSLGFGRRLPIGRPEITARYLDRWGIDEIVLVDISASKQGRLISTELVQRVADSVFVPLSVGGGIRSVDDISTLLRSGADKVVVASSILEDSSLLAKAADLFGDQCLIACMNVGLINGAYKVMDNDACPVGDYPPVLQAMRYAKGSAGEILLNAVHRDGSGAGFDISLCGEIADAVDIPVIALGGAGCPSDFVELFSNTKIAAAAAGNYFNFSEHSVTVAKSCLKAEFTETRIDTRFSYDIEYIDSEGRLVCRSEEDFYNLIFERIVEEVI